MEDEVTRVEAVSYLEGATGHCVLSTLFLVVGAVLLWLGRWGTALITVIVAVGVAMNGLSIYAWDRLRDYFEGAVSDTADTDRTLTPYRVSPEMKAELLAGATMVGSVSVALAVALALTRQVGVRDALPVSMAALAFGNIAALGMAYRREPDS